MMKAKTQSHLPALLLFAVLALFAAPPAADAASGNPPGKITYQGFVTAADGTPLGNQTPTNTVVIFRIWDMAKGGTNKWSEQQNVAIDKGHFSVLLGEGSANDSEPFSADLHDVFAGGDDRYLELTVGTTTLAPRLQFLPTPFAVLAYRARGLTDNAGAQKVYVDSDGMGIGVANPAHPLHVAGKVVATSFEGDGSGLTGINGNHITSGINGNHITSGTIGQAQIATDGVGKGEIQADAVGITEMRDNAVGSAEIINGTIATADIANGAVTGAKLDLTGLNQRIDVGILDGAAQMRIRSHSYVVENGVTDGVLIVQNGLLPPTTMHFDGNDIQAKWNGSPSMLFLNGFGGGVAIGARTKNTSASSPLLQLRGSDSVWGIHIDPQAGTNDDDLEFFCNGVGIGYLDPTGKSWNGYSDRRLKKDIEALEGGILEKLKSFGPVRFRWKEHAEDVPRQIGFIAQDVQQAYPSLVSVEEGGKLGMSYGTMSAVAIGAVKELDARTATEVADLKKENAALKQQLADLLARVQALESKAQ